MNKKQTSQEEIFWSEMGRNIPRFYRMSTFLHQFGIFVHPVGIFYLLLAIAIFFTGLFLQLTNDNENTIIFQRFGSLIASIGFFVATPYVNRLISREIKFFGMHYRALKKDELGIEQSREISFEETPAHLVNIIEGSVKLSNIDNMVEILQLKIKNNTYYLSISIAFIGTIIWGFGDWINLIT